MKWFKSKKQKEKEAIDKAIDYENKLDEAGDYLVEISKTYINKYCETHPNFIGTDRKYKDILVDITDKKEILYKYNDMCFYRLRLYDLNRLRLYDFCHTHNLSNGSKYLNAIKFKYIINYVYFDIEDVLVKNIEDKKILCIKIKEALTINKDDIM